MLLDDCWASYSTAGLVARLGWLLTARQAGFCALPRGAPVASSLARLYAVFHFSYSSWLKPAPFWASLTCSTVKRSWSKSPRFAVEPRRQRVVPLFRNFAHRDIR
jgi:hypothetical protein